MTSIKMPATKDELAVVLNDVEKIKTIFTDANLTKQFNDAQLAISAKEDGAVLNQQIKEQAQITLAEMLGSNGKTPANLTVEVENGKPSLYGKDGKKLHNGKGAIYNKYAPGAELERKWKATENKGLEFSSVGEYCQAIFADGSSQGKAYPNSNLLRSKLDKVVEIQNSFGSEVPADGGFLIPEQMREEILQIALESAVVRPNAMVVPMSTLSLKLPAVDETSRVSSLSGGVTFSFTEESSSIAESQAAFSRIELNARKLAGYFQVPNELLADAPAFSGWFDQRIPEALAWYEDLYFMRGTGVGEPEGFLNSPAMITVNGEAGQATGTIVTENIAGMYQRMLPGSIKNAVWIADIAAFKQLATMGLVVGTGGGPVWMTGGYGAGVVGSPPMTIYGRPLIFSEKVPSLGTAGCLSFVDLGHYAIGDRQAVQIAASEHVAFQNDRTAYRLIERVDGRSWLRSALTPHNNGSTLSAFVQLAAI